MLAPDPQDTVRQLTAILNASNAVTQWAMALENTVLPALSPAPAWYAQISAALKAAQKNSRSWLTSTGPDVQGGMTQTFINYANLFTLAAHDLAGLVAKIEAASPPPPPTAAQVQELTRIVQALLKLAQQQQQTVAGIRGAMNAYRAQMRADHAALRSALQAAMPAEAQAAAAVQQVQLQIQATQDAIATLSADVTEDEITTGKDVVGLIVSLAMSAGEVGLGDLGIAVLGIAADFSTGQVDTAQVQGYVQQLGVLMQELADDQVQLGILHGVVSGIQRLLDSNDDALAAFDSTTDAWELTTYGLGYLGVVLAQPQIDVALVPDLNDLDGARAAWKQMAAFATRVQNMALTQQSSIQIPASA